ncbi:hypothetical protein BD626DRAFT_374 [Schizophyllum amplum]|uniref:Uncharacterized protein n=1 Tax=Schizophyllum amplum TaxID=97359 RepID=A0A550CVG6_9AGAR|nr:hypothetical protein BD626DRAFT_374 [Auriculariopsis ampla]
MLLTAVKLLVVVAEHGPDIVLEELVGLSYLPSGSRASSPTCLRAQPFTCSRTSSSMCSCSSTSSPATSRLPASCTRSPSSPCSSSPEGSSFSPSRSCFTLSTSSSSSSPKSWASSLDRLPFYLNERYDGIPSSRRGPDVVPSFALCYLRYIHRRWTTHGTVNPT